MHARSGGQYEIMGLMQGKLDGDTFVVLDAFALPVVGTETRVNAANEANEFMIQYIESSPAVRVFLTRRSNPSSVGERAEPAGTDCLTR